MISRHYPAAPAMTTSTDTPAAPPVRRGSDAFVQTLIGSGHSLSHFYQMTLPPLFPLMRAELGLSYTALGFLLTLLAVTTGAGQVVAGFLVDRFGARVLLMVGLAIMGIGMGAIGTVHAYWAMAACIVISGFGNCVFHPCDYVILNASVHPSRLGRAFSIHTFVGNVGTAIAPPAMILFATLFGWRGALLVAGALSLVSLTFLLIFGGVLHERQRSKRASTESAAPGAPTGWRLLFSLPFLMMFAFYMTGSMAVSGFQSFGVTSLVKFHGIALDSANVVLTAFLAANAIGILVGGYLADHMTRHGPMITAAFTGSAAVAVFVGVIHLATGVLFVAFGVIGLLQGMTRPSRDIVTRRMTPDRDVGKVFAFVSSGLNAGSAVAPAVFGLFLDYGHPQLVFIGVAVFLLMGVATIGTSRMYAAPAPVVRAQAAE
jgi:MFS transporter, FSR family, fosmidomycin resistance protein